MSPEGGPANDGGETDLQSLRNEIDRVDEQILEDLARRRALSRQMARAKAEGAPVRDPKREQDLLVRRVLAGSGRGLDAYYVTRIFHEILDDSIRLQQECRKRLADPGGAIEPIRVAFQGIEGAYSQLAAKAFFAEHAGRLDWVGLASFAEVVRAVEQGRADYAMLPVLNTISGRIDEVSDLLRESRLAIVGETSFRVRHCLVARDEVPLENIRRIFSHPQGIAQCSDFLSALVYCEIEPYTDTAMSVLRVKCENDPTLAAIASEEAAVLYGLHVLERDVGNQAENFTRFLIGARAPGPVG